MNQSRDFYPGGRQYVYGTTAVRVKDGYLGQIIFGDEIIWESAPFYTVEDALADAHDRLIDRVKFQ